MTEKEIANVRMAVRMLTAWESSSRQLRSELEDLLEKYPTPKRRPRKTNAEILDGLRIMYSRRSHGK